MTRTDICRCGKKADRRVLFEKLGSVLVCAGCAYEWEHMKAFIWGQFIDAPKFREPRGLNAARQHERGMLDKKA